MEEKEHTRSTSAAQFGQNAYQWQGHDYVTVFSEATVSNL
jgi:hypothetical protein